MTTLLIELAGPQQSWGSSSRFATRSTELAPTRSGIIGMLAAALGMERTAPLDRFRDLRIGVRIDQPGTLERDFQTTRSFDGSRAFPLSHRYYLADAVFLAGVEGPRDELVVFRDALAHPYFPLFLGRRAFPPSGPLPTELIDASVADALREAPWRARPHHRRSRPETKVTVSMVLDRAEGEPPGETRQDVPESFDPRRRRYSARDITVRHVTLDHPDPRPHHGSPVREERLESPTDHDPFALLSDEEL